MVFGITSTGLAPLSNSIYNNVRAPILRKNVLQGAGMGIGDDIRPRKHGHVQVPSDITAGSAESDKEEPKHHTTEVKPAVIPPTDFFDAKVTTAPSKESGSKLIWILLFVLLLFGAIFAYIFFAPSNSAVSTTDTPSQTDTKTSTQPASDDLTLTTPTTGTTATTTPAATVTPPAPAAPAPASINLAVFNGNGIKGSAQSVVNLLTSAGFSVGKATNAKSFTYAKTIIYYKDTKTAELDVVKKALVKTVTAEVNNKLAGSHDMIIVVGKDW